MNIREFAAHCNLSISSVSRALNNPVEFAQMSPKTYEYVHAMARKLGYRPNYHAKAFLGKSSNCIGFIGGSGMNYIGISLLEGLSDIFDDREMAIYISSTRNDVSREIKAFDKMFYRKVDAIAFLPILQEGEYRTDHLAELLEKNPSHPPVLSLLGGVEIPGMFQLRMKDAEAGRRAALRQLRLGCRKFGIISILYNTPGGACTVEAYRRTLLENGVPEQEIKEVKLWHSFPLEQQDVLRDIDGIWIIYYLLIPECYHALNKVCNLKKLHVDTISTLENEDLLFWLQIDMSSVNRICDHFASLNVFQYSSYQIGVQTGNMLLKMIGTPSLEPYSCELEWNAFIPGKQDVPVSRSGTGSAAHPASPA